MKISAPRLAILAAAITVLPQAASAHTFGADGAGLAHGFMHPVGGWDHLLAMVAVGLWAAQRGGRSFWMLPASFVAVMVIGGLLGLAGVALPQVELGITASVVVLGALIAVQARLPLETCLAAVGLFGLFHGHAHGTEMPDATAPVLYGLGFVAATTLLHLGGLGIARTISASMQDRLSRIALRGTGAVVGLTGLALALAG